MKRLIFILLQAMYFVPSRAQVAPDTVMMLRDLKALRETGKGRLTGSRDNRMAQFYILGRLRDEGVAGCWGTYEQPFFFERGGKRIMGTNLTACIGGRSSRPICMAASYGTDDSMEFPGQPAAAAILLGVAGYFRRNPRFIPSSSPLPMECPGPRCFPEPPGIRWPWSRLLVWLGNPTPSCTGSPPAPETRSQGWYGHWLRIVE